MRPPCEGCNRETCPEPCFPLVDYKKHVKKQNPCYKCEVRHAGCHGSCEAYQTWRKEQEALNSKIKAAKLTPADDYTIRGMNKRLQREQRRKQK